MSRWIRPDRRARLKLVHELSLLRIERYGSMPGDPEVWWHQLTQVAAENGLAMPTREQWHEAFDVERWDMPL